MDRISNLPEDILCHIGSFLSAKEAAFTTVLSKRWQNLITIIQDLHFDGSVKNGERFTDFVVRVLDLPASSRVRSFSIERVRVGQYVDVNRCLCDVVKRGVLVLELKTKVKKGYSLPLEIFTCKTVEKLTLGSGFVIDILPNDAFLPALKTLFLDSVRFYDSGGRCAFTRLLSVSPLLEELVLDGVEFEQWKWSEIVSSPTLQRLTIRRQAWEPYVVDSDGKTLCVDCRALPYEFDRISLDLPGLKYLDYSDYVPKEFVIVNLNSLVEAKLNLQVDYDTVWLEDEHADDFNPTNLINGIKNVENLDFCSITNYMFGVFIEAIPMFEKLSHITVTTDDACWYPLVRMIKNSPNLKTLIIKSRLHYEDSLYARGSELLCDCVSEYSCLVSCPLEVLEVTLYYGSPGEVEQMKHILGKLSCLKLVKIHAHVSGSSKVRVMADLLKLPRASPKCKIKVKFV